MTRGEIITQALRIIKDQNLVDEGRDWLNSVLYRIESVGFWRFLEKNVTYQTVTNTKSIPFSTLNLTDYSKGMFISSSGNRRLEMVSKSAYHDMDDGLTGSPTHFAIWNDTLNLYPTPVTGSLPILTIFYYKNITIPTSDTDDLYTVSSIPIKWHPYLINGVIAEGMAHVDDSRQVMRQQMFEGNLLIMMRENADYYTGEESKIDRSALLVKQIQHTPVEPK